MWTRIYILEGTIRVSFMPGGISENKTGEIPDYIRGKWLVSLDENTIIYKQFVTPNEYCNCIKKC